VSASDDAGLAQEARENLLRAIAAQAVRAPNATTLLRLAEAYAWVVEPAQPHGGTSED
jgi:hypothetical protein